ncbi:MAG: periplasmic heavy metal sensor, partial [bacterium]|nr:periplasmic heavy metal sensor [bacterium]
MFRTPKLSALIILLLAVSNTADAGGPRRGGPPGPPPMDRVLERHADRLGLDADTRDEIRRIAAESRDASEPIHDRLRALHDEMRELLGAQTPDEAR